MSQPVAPQRSSQLVAWLLYVPQLLLDLVLGVFGIFSVFATDSCGSVEDEPAVCNGDYFSTVLFSFWFALLGLIVVVPILIFVSARRGGRPWVWPLLGGFLSIVLVVVFFALMTR
ncbi:magnesium-transporting ATPase (P-type) [Aeromicrobium panaciterrae]|uniref:Magnesium-transporting ATPase (P-type) n=1 Tax=Aeromicrobium panaciterrae TaxID=363861 RepID=A0ABU1UK68_9ACTN|nr:hypothetical protein [Aeromicrobium panaciterrae]MDR7085576.1 magnesium-transporting ATPase (P-type) [Aeromicrobium panaciterrae]